MCRRLCLLAKGVVIATECSLMAPVLLAVRLFLASCGKGHVHFVREMSRPNDFFGSCGTYEIDRSCVCDVVSRIFFLIDCLECEQRRE